MTPLFNKQTICMLAILLSGSLEAALIQAQDREPATVAPGSNAITDEDIAPGSVEDTIRACMARIPQDASIGQRMIAQQGCWKDQNDREPFESVPGARKIQNSQKW
jgi:hypothetical protein